MSATRPNTNIGRSQANQNGNCNGILSAGSGPNATSILWSALYRTHSISSYWLRSSTTSQCTQNGTRWKKKKHFKSHTRQILFSCCSRSMFMPAEIERKEKFAQLCAVSMPTCGPEYEPFGRVVRIFATEKQIHEIRARVSRHNSLIAHIIA